MQKMIRSPAGPGTIGQPWWRRRELVTCARRLNRATTAAAVAHAGQKMFMKFNIKYIKNESRKKTRNKKIQTRKREGDRANTSVYKPSSSREQEESPQAKGSSFKPESTSSKIFFPGYKRTSPWFRVQATRIKVFFLCLIWKEIWWGENLTDSAFFGAVDFNSTVKKCPLGA